MKSYALCSCTGPPVERRSGWPSRPACEPGEIAMPPVVAGINHCAAVHGAAPARRQPTPCRSLREHAPRTRSSRWALDTYGVLPYCWSHWVEHFPQMQRLEGEYAGTAQGVEMRYGITTHDMAYEKARVAELEALAAKLDGARRRRA